MLAFPTTVSTRSLLSRDVPADGSCFFTAIGSLLRLSSGFETDLSAKEMKTFSRTLREEVANEVLENPDKYRLHLKEEVGCSPEKYADIIKRSLTWGGYIDAAILSCLYEVSIIILALDPRKGEYFSIKIGDYPYAIAIQFEEDHYNYLVTSVEDEVYLTLEEVNAFGDKWKECLVSRINRKSTARLAKLSNTPNDSDGNLEQIRINAPCKTSPPSYREACQNQSNIPHTDKKNGDLNVGAPEESKAEHAYSDKISQPNKVFTFRRYNSISKSDKSPKVLSGDTINLAQDKFPKDDKPGLQRNLHLNLENSDSDNECGGQIVNPRSPLKNIKLWGFEIGNGV